MMRFQTLSAHDVEVQNQVYFSRLFVIFDCSFLQYIRPHVTMAKYQIPEPCRGCEGLCIQAPKGTFICTCTSVSATNNIKECLFGTTHCSGMLESNN